VAFPRSRFELREATLHHNPKRERGTRSGRPRPEPNVSRETFDPPFRNVSRETSPWQSGKVSRETLVDGGRWMANSDRWATKAHGSQSESRNWTRERLHRFFIFHSSFSLPPPPGMFHVKHRAAPFGMFHVKRPVWQAGKVSRETLVDGGRWLVDGGRWSMALELRRPRPA